MLPPVSSNPTSPVRLDALTDLARGAKGPAVSALQQALNRAGFHLAVDGDFGPQTEQAVRDFQQQHGLKADGIAGPKTKAALATGTAAPAIAANPRPATLDLNRELLSPDSRLSVAIGVAEGTRTPDGGRTAAYKGHVDPKRGYNVGTFSYQHQTGSPRQADQLQLQEFKRFQPMYEEACRKAGLNPSDPLLAGSTFDLYNQAPLAATGRGGFLDQFPALAKNGVTPENIAEARYRSYYDPNKGKFDTTFTLPELKADQQRRTGAIVSVLGRSTAHTPVPEGKVGYESQGPEVARLKQALKDAGFYNGPINDQMGNQGIEALEKAKRALNIGGPVDVAGAETIQKICDFAKSRPNLHVEVDFVSQFDNRVPGDRPGQPASVRCDNACQYMMENNSNPAARVSPTQSDSDVHAYNGGGRADAQVRYLESQLRSGRPVMIGVHHPEGTRGTGNPHGINHYLVATGTGTDQSGRQYITFNDPAHTDPARGRDTNPENRLYLNNGRFAQDGVADPYELRGVVSNR